MVRFGTEGDRFEVVKMMPQANVAAGLGPDGPMPINIMGEVAHAIFTQHLHHPSACTVVYAPHKTAVGFLMAVIYNHPWDNQMNIAKDTGLYIRPADRGGFKVLSMMMMLYEDWATSRGCIFAGMAGMGEDPKIGNFLKRRGYFAAETHYLKKLV